MRPPGLSLEGDPVPFEFPGWRGDGVGLAGGEEHLPPLRRRAPHAVTETGAVHVRRMTATHSRRAGALWILRALCALWILVCSSAHAAARSSVLEPLDPAVAPASSPAGDPCSIDTDGDGVVDCLDGCPNDPNKLDPGVCGCGVPDTDTDGDGTPDCVDGCPADPDKIAPGACGCGVRDVDTDGDGVLDCFDGCPFDPRKSAPGICGCGVEDLDTDGDGAPNCIDGCPNDPNKLAPGACGCGVPDTDTDGDGTPDCNDLCPGDPLKLAPGTCGCGVPDTDTDGDGTPDCNDLCPDDPLKVAPGNCGCGVPETDTDGDGTPDCSDLCPNDPLKVAPGTCGCGVPDLDSDGDLVLDCNDGCPLDPLKTSPGICGCGVPENPITFYRDADGDGFGNASVTTIACSAPPGFVSNSTDCDDTRQFVHPGALELCGNRIDDDCDGQIEPDFPSVNPIAAENALPGDPPSEWEVTGAGDPSIQGFSTPFSVNHGESVHFKIKTDSNQYRIDIYRIGWYQGNGARKMATILPSAPLPQVQPACMTELSTGLVDCGNWAVSATWNIPPQAVSGVYFARPVRLDGASIGLAGHIPFVVRADDHCGGLLFQTSDATWQAYNSYGGASLYVDRAFGLPAGRGKKVSYNRPFDTRNNTDGLGKRDYFFWAEYPMVRWLESNGYRVSYTSGIDTAARGAELLDFDAFLSVGHDEYWSGDQRANVEAARDAGVHLAFLSGNEVFWKTRWEASKVDRAEYRTLVCYKETHSNMRSDPEPGVWTGTWRDPRFRAVADGGRPENELTGTIFMVNGPVNDSLVVPYDESRLRLWRNTPLGTMLPGQSAYFAAGILGHEWNMDLDNGFRPAGLVRYSRAQIYQPYTFLWDNGSTYGTGTAHHSLTMYRAPSGALVFGAGTIQWAWGLDGEHDGSIVTPSNTLRQATVNLLAEFGAQPSTLRSPLVAAFASTDETAPTAWIVGPRHGERVPTAEGFWIHGEAFDTGGGKVGGVEVSIDGGKRWYAAEGRERWGFRVPPGGAGTMILLCRATDDSLNTQSRMRPVRIERAALTNGAQHLFTLAAAPTSSTSGEQRAVEVGVRFRSTVNGYVTGVRFYKGEGNVGRHIGSLWASNGTRLASAEFRVETESGWQEVEFRTPVPITAGALYTASYHAPNGHMPVQQNYFASQDLVSGPLVAPRTQGLTGNGVYRYGASGFPTDSFQSSNYWVDVSFRTSLGPWGGAGY